MTAFIPDLVKLGLHLVRVNAAKQAMDQGWQNKPWAGDGTLPELVGLVPGRSAWAVVDVDPPAEAKTAADVDAAVRDRIRAITGALGLKPVFGVHTPSGGMHLYYRLAQSKFDPGDEVGNWKLTVGDLRCDKGYVVLWEGAAEGLMKHWREPGQIPRPDFMARIAALRSVNAPKAPKPPKAPKGGCKATGHRRGTQEGDRHNGLLAKVRCAAENDWEPQHAIEAAVQVARTAGQPEDDIQRVVGWATEKGLATRKPHLPPWGGWTPPEQVEEAKPKPTPCPLPDVPSGPPDMPAEPSPSPRPGKRAFEAGKLLKTPEEVASAWARTREAQWWHLYDAATAKQGRWMTWFPNSGWRPDPKGAAAKQAIASFSQARFGVHDEDAQKLVHNPVRGGSASVVNTAYAMASAYEGMTLFEPDWDANPFLVGLPGAMCHDLRTGETRKQAPGDMLLLCTGVAPGDASKSGLAKIFRHGLLPEDVDGFERMLGSMLFGASMGRGVPFMPGKRGVGKSLALRRVAGALGPYAGVVEAKAVCVAARKDIAHTAQDRARRLAGVRIATVSEWSRSAKLDPVLFNEATGHDRQVARAAGGLSHERTPSWSALMVMNDLPDIEADRDGEAVAATFDRLRVYRFANPLPKGLASKLWAGVSNPEQNADDLAWLFDCARRFVIEGHAPLSEAMSGELIAWWDRTFRTEEG